MEINTKQRLYPILLAKGLKFIMDFLECWIISFLDDMRGYLNLHSALPVLQLTMNDHENYQEHKRCSLLNNENAFFSTDIYLDNYQNDNVSDGSGEIDNDHSNQSREEEENVSYETNVLKESYPSPVLKGSQSLSITSDSNVK